MELESLPVLRSKRLHIAIEEERRVTGLISYKCSWIGLIALALALNLRDTPDSRMRVVSTTRG